MKKINFDSNTLIAYITAGFPDMKFTQSAILALQEAGASALEIGVPYSDPVADGPTIAEASLLSLESGTNLDMIFDAVEEISDQIKIPVYIMSYYPPLDSYGMGRVIEGCLRAGIDGVIFPDVSIDECKDDFVKMKDKGLDPILLVFPNTKGERLEDVARYSGSFVYFVNLFGTTGMRDKIPTASLSQIDNAARTTDKPIAAGFGVSNHDMFKELSEHANAVIIGSAIVRRVLDNRDDRDAALKSISDFVKDVLGK